VSVLGNEGLRGNRKYLMPLQSRFSLRVIATFVLYTIFPQIFQHTKAFLFSIHSNKWNLETKTAINCRNAVQNM
jgi:hypothetical protein